MDTEERIKQLADRVKELEDERKVIIEFANATTFEDYMCSERGQQTVLDVISERADTFRDLIIDK